MSETSKTTQHMKVVDPLSSHPNNTKLNVFKTWCSDKHSAGLRCDWLCLVQVCRCMRLQVNLPTCAGRADGVFKMIKTRQTACNTSSSSEVKPDVWPGKRDWEKLSSSPD